MDKHETKICPRCQASFECKVGSIHLCQCWKVPLNAEERQYIKETYEECLCAECLMAEKRNFQQQQFNQRLKQISTDKFH